MGPRQDPVPSLVVIVDQMRVRDVAAHRSGRDVTHFHLQLLSVLLLMLLLVLLLLLMLLSSAVVLGVGVLQGSLVHLGPVQWHSETQIQVVRIVMRLLLAVVVARVAATAVVGLGLLPLGVLFVLHPPVLEPYFHLE